MYNVLFCVIVFLIAGCSDNNVIEEVYQLDYEASGFRRLPTPVVEWTIDEKNLQKLQHILSDKITKEVSIPSYRLQVIGYVANETKLVWFNGFCIWDYDGTSDYWKERYVGIIGSGNCGFEGLYNTDSGEMSDFEWNVTCFD